MQTLKRVTKENIREIIPSSDAKALRSQELVFEVNLKGPAISDSLVKFEIALRKGERVGFFKTSHAAQKKSSTTH